MVKFLEFLLGCRKERDRRLDVPSSAEDAVPEGRSHGNAPSSADPFEPLRVAFDLTMQGPVRAIRQPARECDSFVEKGIHDGTDLPSENE